MKKIRLRGVVDAAAACFTVARVDSFLPPSPFISRFSRAFYASYSNEIRTEVCIIGSRAGPSPAGTRLSPLKFPRATSSDPCTWYLLHAR